MPNKEYRAFTVEKVETRQQNGKEIKTVSGYAAVFNVLSDNLGGFRERIAPGAFAASIRTDDIKALINHDPNLLLGRNRAGTLRLKEDARGLAVEIDLPDTQDARDLAVSMERGDIDQMSFAFITPMDGDTWQEIEGEIIRTLLKAELFDVSIVTYPAYPQTSIALNSLLPDGLDQPTLAAAAIRARHGLALADEHKAALETYAGEIRSLLPQENPPGPLPGDNQPPAHRPTKTDLHNPNDYESTRRRRLHATHGRKESD